MWNVPKYAGLAAILMLNGEVPEHYFELFEMRDMERQVGLIE